MKKSANHATREALGCFVMLILGAILTLGATLVVVPRGITALVGGDATGWRVSALAWVVAPAAGIALTAWFTYGLRIPGRPKKRR
jgi:hypothetical protein